MLRLTVSEGVDKPYLFKGVAFKRVGMSNHRVSRDDLERIIVEKYRELVSFEGRALELDVGGISDEEIRRFVSTVKATRNIDLPYADKLEFLRRLGLIRENRLTNEAVHRDYEISSYSMK